VVKQSGGDVVVDSALGSGSTFKIFLPRTQESGVAASPEEAAITESAAMGTILLVEDEEALLDLTAERLTQQGYTVLKAHDGAHALELESSHKGTIDLLLTDVMMPKIGGLTLARSMAKLRPRVRIAFMSGHADRESSFREAPLSGAESIQKPFSHAQLLNLAHRALEAPPVQVQD
jgi:two-component system cell cycle sensor histidine kinase/response regulator CckA